MPALVKDKIKKQIQKQTDDYMKSVESFLKDKNNGVVPPEYECSLLMLRAYYKEFIQLTQEIDKLDTVLIESRYGLVPNPILAARDKVVAKLDTILKQIGCTFVAAKRLKLEKAAETPLDEFIK